MTDRSDGDLLQQAVIVDADGATLSGDLAVPSDGAGVVLLAHGSGSSRFSPRNRFVAERLQASGLATLLIDLLTPDEEAIDQYSRELRFDIGLLAGRLTACADWLAADERTTGLPLGLFGASTGAAAALICAAQRPAAVSAVVSRGGRPDLAGADALAQVVAPTLLIVGERDEIVLDLNRRAQALLRAQSRLEIVPRATHLFEEPGTLEQVAELAADWLVRWLVKTDGSART
jgi:putative phosphoribosyl transferase